MPNILINASIINFELKVFDFFVQVKAFIDANIEFKDLLVDGDPHLHSALLKSYLRELPEPLLGRKSSAVYQMWCDAALLRDPTTRIKEITRILHQELPPRVVINIQYLVKVRPSQGGYFYKKN